MEDYAYSDLQDGDFRLLRITKAGDLLECELKHFSIENPPDFHALSYSWGDEPPTRTLVCNGRLFYVRENLYQALHELGKKNENVDQWLFVDAVCIDQGNSDEKAIQVKAMSSIYSGASNVIVWLGTAQDGSDHALDTINSFMENIWPIPEAVDALESTWKLQDRLPPSDDPVWPAVSKLYNRPWFRRGWVMQEVILAQNVSVLCGDRIIPWFTLATFAKYLYVLKTELVNEDNHSDDQKDNSGFRSCLDLDKLRVHGPNNNEYTFKDLYFFAIFLQLSRQRQFSDPRDHVYGLLGLFRPELRDALDVRYEHKSVEQTYIDFCKLAVQADPYLNILSMAPSLRKADSLPSWCPDFRSSSKEQKPYYAHEHFHAGKLENSGHPGVKVPPEHNTIGVQGFRIDIVKEVVRTIPDGSDLKDNIPWEAECYRMYQSVTESATVESIDAYCRTLIADNPVDPYRSLRDNPVVLRGLWTYGNYDWTSEMLKSVMRFAFQMSNQRGRRFFATNNGKIGMGPSLLEPGDIICVLSGAGPLFALRPSAEAGTYQLVGDAFMHGYMDLETMPEHSRGPDETFWIC